MGVGERDHLSLGGPAGAEAITHLPSGEPLSRMAAEFTGEATRLAEWVGDTAAEILACCVLGRKGVPRTLRSTTAVERHHEEVRRRTRVFGILLHQARPRRPLTALAIEANDRLRVQRWLIAPTFEREEAPRRRAA